MRYKLITLILFIAFKLNAQTEGISYQAVIIGTTDKELPGINASNNLLVSSSVSFEFTIVDEDDNPLYRETQSTQTDSKGLVHLIIGSGSPSVGLFNQIMWDGTLKNLIVEIDLKGGTDFSFLSQQSFLYLPYEYHRDITASGNVDIDGDFNVDGLTQFNDDVMLDGDSYVGGLLTVDGGTILNIITPSARSNNNKALTVNGYSLINGNFEVANSSITSLTGKLTVDGITDLNNMLNVDGETTLNETFTVTSSSTSFLTGDLNVDGTTQLNEILNVTGNTGLASNLTVTGTTELNNTLNVAGNTGLASSLTVAGATQLKRNLSVSGSTQLSSLEVDGPALINNSLTIATSNTSSFTGPVSIDGITDLNSNLIVDGTTLLNSSLTVANASPSILTGTLQADGITDLNSNLIVDGTTLLNSSLTVANASPSIFTGTLRADGITDLNSNLIVDGTTLLNSSLTVANASPSIFTGTLRADGITDLNSNLIVDGTSALNQVTIDAGNLGSTATNYGQYPLRVQGNGQGIAIKVTAGLPSNSNNYITFFDSSGGVRGRIEGETASDVFGSRDYNYRNDMFISNLVVKSANVGLAAIPVVVVGLGGSAGPCGACIATAAADLAMLIVDEVSFQDFKQADRGVTYQSGSGDYAEWLERLNPDESISAGDVVGVYNGKISKYIGENVQKILVISTSPAVLGNMPSEENIPLNEKVAFLGQVPVKVKGDVFAGDYILPSGDNNGIGIGVSKSDLKAVDYKNIIGVAWTSSLENEYDIVKIAIGLNSNDIADFVDKQQQQINSLEERVALIESKLAPNSDSLKNITSKKEPQQTQNNTQTYSNKSLMDSFPPYLTEQTIKDVEETLRTVYNTTKALGTIPPGLEKLVNDSVFRSKVIDRVKKIYRQQYLSRLDEYKKIKENDEIKENGPIE